MNFKLFFHLDSFTSLSCSLKIKKDLPSPQDTLHELHETGDPGKTAGVRWDLLREWVIIFHCWAGSILLENLQDNNITWIAGKRFSTPLQKVCNKWINFYQEGDIIYQIDCNKGIYTRKQLQSFHIVLGKTLNSSVVVLSMTLNSRGAIEETILWVLLQFAPLHSWFFFFDHARLTV